MNTKPALVLGGLPQAGKTAVIEGLLFALKARGKSGAGYKPFDSGLIAHNARELPMDCERLARQMDHSPSLALVTPYTGYEDYPIELALRRDSTKVDWKFIAARRQIIEKSYDFCLTEVPGGLATPLTEEKSVFDWLKELGEEVVYLVRPEPKGLNQMLLELERLNQSDLEYSLVFCNLAGNQDGDWMFYQWEKAEATAGRQALGMLPFLDEPTAENLGAAIEEHLPGLIDRLAARPL